MKKKTEPGTAAGGTDAAEDSEIKIIGGAHGPVVIALWNSTDKNSFAGIKQAVRRSKYNRKRKKAIKSITAVPHTAEELIAYITEKYRAVELSQDAPGFAERRKCCKAGLVQKYAPQALGEPWEMAPPDFEDQEAVKEFFKKIEEQQEKAARVPEDIFPVDYHIYQIEIPGYGSLQLEIEKIREYVTDTAYPAGSKEDRALLDIIRDIYLYLGVSEQDIRDCTERYSRLIWQLAERN